MFCFKQIPGYFNKFFKKFKKILTKPQLDNFRRLVSGLVLSDRKNIQEINSVYGDKDQSSLNRFVTESDWSMKEVNNRRLEFVKDKLYNKSNEGLIIIDDEVLHKTGKKMEKANYHYSGTTKEKEWGHNVVDGLYIDLVNNNHFPIDIKSYLRKQDCDKYNKFKTKREIALEIIDTSLNNGINGMVCCDAWYYSEGLVKEIKYRRLNYMTGIRTTLKISICRNKRVSVADYINNLNKEDFKVHKLKNGNYYLHNKVVSIRGEGKSMLLVSFKENDNEIKCYVTNMLTWTNNKYMATLLKRWNIECLHRNNKQHLGLEDYQVRKYRGMQVVALAVLAAYTLLILNAIPSLLKKFRPLQTIGEMCRFAKITAQKSKYWMKKTFSNIDKGRKILNQLVLVKNAKV